MRSNWPTKKLGEIISFEKGKKMIISGTGKPYIGIDSIRTNQYSVFTQKNDGVHCNPDDVLVVWDGAHAGTTGTALGGYVGSTVVKVLHDDSMHHKFLFYLLKFSQEKIRAAAQGAAIPHLSKVFINNLRVPVPPLATQQQIVERLDKIAEAQKLNDGLIQKTDELFQSLLYRELNPAGKNLEVRKLGDIIKPQYGYTTSAKDSGNYRFIRITDIGDEGELRDSDKKYVTLSRNEAENYQLKNGDLLLARTGATFGKILHFEKTEPAIFASFLIRLNPDASIDPFYIWLFSRSQNYWRQARTLMTGSGQPQFNANKLKQIKIPVPPIKYQKQIVAKLSAVQDYKKQLLEQKLKLKELFDSALQKSMRGD